MKMFPKITSSKRNVHFGDASLNIQNLFFSEVSKYKEKIIRIIGKWEGIILYVRKLCIFWEIFYIF